LLPDPGKTRFNVAAPQRKLSADDRANAAVNTTDQGTLPAGNIPHNQTSPAMGSPPRHAGTAFASWGSSSRGVVSGRAYTRSGSMNEKEFQTKLAELMGEISTLPATERAKLEKIATETRARHDRLRATVSSLQESLDYLRLSIKYLVFDLEATRRENGYLRKMLEETSGND
jgi:hypothetical protein